MFKNMRRQVLKTYEKKNNEKHDFSSIQGPSISRPLEIKKFRNKQVLINSSDDSLEITVDSVFKNKKTSQSRLNDTLNDPFETTFDRLLKEYKDQPIPPPVKGISYTDNSGTESDTSFLKNLKSNSKENKTIKERSIISNSESDNDFSFTKNPAKESGKYKKMKIPAEGKKLIDDDPINVTTFASPVKETSFADNLGTESDTSFLKNLKLNSKQNKTMKGKSIISNSESDNDFSFTKNPAKESGKYKKLKILAERNKLIDDDSLNVTAFASPVKGNVSNASDNEKSQLPNLRNCSVPLVPCDLDVKKQKSKIQPCSVVIPRLIINSPSATIQVSAINNTENAERKESFKRKSNETSAKTPKRPRIENLEKISEKSKRKSRKIFENIIRNSIGAKENMKKSRKVPVGRKTSSPSVIKNSPIVKDCSVNLTRIDSPVILSKNYLISSTPFVKKTGNLSNEYLEISDIASPIVTSEISPIPSKSTVTAEQFKEPSVRLVAISQSTIANLRNNSSQDFHETWNDSSDYSEMDWETVSYSESQLAREPSLQRKFRSFPPADKIKPNSTRNSSFSSSSRINRNSAKKIIENKTQSDSTVNGSVLINKILKVSLERCDVGAKRLLNKTPEYETSVSLFDDTSQNFNSSQESSNLAVDSKLMKCPSLVLTKLEFTNPSLLNQSNFKGFEEKSKLSPRILSPMISIPANVVHSIAVDDSSLINDKSFESPGCEKSSLRRRLDYDEEPEIQNDSFASNLEESPIKNDKSVDKKRRSSFDVSVVLTPLKMEKFQCVDKSILSTRDDDTLETKNQGEFSRIDSDSSLSNESSNCAITSSDSVEDNNSSILGNTQDEEPIEESLITSSQSAEEDSLSTENIYDKSKYEKYVEEFKNTRDISGSEVEDAETFILENSVKLNKKVPKILADKQEENRLVTKAVNNKEINKRESFGQLKDSVRVTHRRKNYRNWQFKLSDITENDRYSGEIENADSAPDDVEIIPEEEENEKKASNVAKDIAVIPKILENGAEASKFAKGVAVTAKIVENGEEPSNFADDIEIISEVTGNESLINNNLSSEQTLFLKPGKSWARSLSILNNIHCQKDVDTLAVGKGKNWRHSVYSILDMQNKGNLQSCTKKRETFYSQPVGALRNAENYRTERFSSQGSVSPSRVCKRISIRVVPDVTRRDADEDTQFLEAYGIPSSQSTKPSQRSLSLRETDSFAATPEKSLVDLEDSGEFHPVVTAKDVVLEKCHQTDYLTFSECYPKKFLKHCRKIGEGVYGEVFLHNHNSDSSVIKIIPIEGDEKVNGEPQKKFQEILSEIVIAKELHDLRFNEKNNTSSFIEVKNIKCIVGKYPEKLIEHWQKFDDEKKSDNDCPAMFGNDQLYISLELGNGGLDLEAFVFQNADESYSVFVQTAIAMAVAEQSLEFEHRDMHWGNILISRTKKTNVSYKLGDLEINLPSNGLKVAIIDFTLSRMLYKGCCIYNDLAQDPELFTAEGEYQFEIYRLMRDKLGNDWRQFEPYTNILWLHYTIGKMIQGVRYSIKKGTKKIHKNGIEKLENLKEIILSYDSAYDLVTKCDKFTAFYADPDSSTDDNDK